MVFQKGHKGFKKKKIEAQVGNEQIEAYDNLAEEALNSDEAERGELPGKKRHSDPISQMVGASFYVQNKYEHWQNDRKKNRIMFSRFYPAKKLYIDIFDRTRTQAELDNRKQLVETHGCKYIGINFNESFDNTKIRSVLGV